MSYEYDLFISYNRTGDVKEWVWLHFVPRLRASLSNLLPYDPAIWVDIDQDDGTWWPLNIKRSLKRSKFMVSIWTPRYFRSQWCMAEWQTMRDREKRLGMGTESNPQGLVYPIKFSDGSYFDADAMNIQCKKDFAHKRLNKPYAWWRQTHEYLDFHNLVDEVAQELSEWLPRAPEWMEDWPEMTTPTMLQPARASRPVL